MPGLQAVPGVWMQQRMPRSERHLWVHTDQNEAQWEAPTDALHSPPAQHSPETAVQAHLRWLRRCSNAPLVAATDAALAAAQHALQTVPCLISTADADQVSARAAASSGPSPQPPAARIDTLHSAYQTGVHCRVGRHCWWHCCCLTPFPFLGFHGCLQTCPLLVCTPFNGLLPAVPLDF